MHPHHVAVDQLQTLGRKIGVPVFHTADTSPVELARQAVITARNTDRDVVIIDTAGRLAIDEALMQEVVDIKAAVRPKNVLFVVDAMIGQDAVRTAKAFDERRRVIVPLLNQLPGFKCVDPGGAFYAALDADSEGHEGRFYVWTVTELIAALGPDADAALAWLGATDQGNFAEGGVGANVLESRGAEPDAATRERIRARLLAVRAGRVRPATDDKRLTSWNALMIAALADAGAALGRPDYLDAARDTAAFVLARLRTPEGRLLRTYNRGEAKLAGYLEDHAFLLEALLTLYEATFEERWFSEARALPDVILERFADPERGGFYSTADDGEQLVARRKELEDHPIPAGGSSAALGLLRLELLTGEARYGDAARGHLRLLHPIAARHPGAFAHTLQAIDLALGPAREVALVGPDLTALAAVVRSALRPRLVLAGGPGPSGAVPLLEGRQAVDGRATAYVCERFACRHPVTGPAELAALLGD